MAMNIESTAGAKGEQTRRAILEAAVIRFGRDGYRATSVADIARDADVGGTVAYRYFPSKEALFFAALDEDAAGVVQKGVSRIISGPIDGAWLSNLMPTLVGAVERHPLARRVLAGLEPHVTNRMLDLPALSELRITVGKRIKEEQLAGNFRNDVDPIVIGSGAVSIWLSLLMSVIQFGHEGMTQYGADIVAVFEAALDPPSVPLGKEL